MFKGVWQGVNERANPVLLPPNIFRQSEGVIFREGSAARIEGKQTSQKVDHPILSLFQFGAFALLQTTTNLYFLNVETDLLTLPEPIVPPEPVELTYVSDGDTNGLFYYLGTNYGVAAWANPHTATRLVVGAFNSSNVSDIAQGTAAGPVNRDYGDSNRTSNSADSYWKFSLLAGQVFTINKYSFKARPSGSGTASNVANWKLQGSNDGTTWTDLDTRTGITYTLDDEWKTYDVTGASDYRYFRILHQGNVTGANSFFFLTEIEFYGIWLV